jgi:hypothetical protein
MYDDSRKMLETIGNIDLSLKEYKNVLNKYEGYLIDLESRKKE